MEKMRKIILITMLAIVVVVAGVVVFGKWYDGQRDSTCILPKLLYSYDFESYSQIAAVKRVAEYTDEEDVQRYLDKNERQKYKWEAIKANIDEILDLLGDVNMVYLKGTDEGERVVVSYKLDHASSYPVTDGYMHTWYKCEDYELVVECYYQEKDYPEEYPKDKETHKFKEKINIGKYEVDVYVHTFEREEYIECGFETENSYVFIRYIYDGDPYKWDERIKENLEILTLNEIIDQNQWEVNETALEEASDIVHAKYTESKIGDGYVDYLFTVQSQLKGDTQAETITVRYYDEEEGITEPEQLESDTLFETDQEYTLLLSREKTQDEEFYRELEQMEMPAVDYPIYEQFIRDYYPECLEEQE